MRFAYALALILLTVSATSAQRWPTTDWVIQNRDGSPITGPQVEGARIYQQQLREASVWLQRAGYPAPRSILEGSGRRYVADLQADTTEEGAFYRQSPDPEEDRRLYLSSAPVLWTPARQNPGQYLLTASPVHELFHSIQAVTFPSSEWPSGTSCRSASQNGGGSAVAWLLEGSASAIQVRWLEETEGRPYLHTYRDPRRGTWVRYFDHSLHRPAHTVRSVPPGETLFWQCGYGTWYFWYAAGEFIGRTPEQKLGYLQYVLGGPNDWSDLGLKNLDFGLRRAAVLFGTPERYDGGLYEIYPEFIAQYADDVRHFETPNEVVLQSRSQVVHRRGTVGPLAATAVEVRVEVPSGTVGSSRVRIFLEPAPNRDQLHLIEGHRVIRRPSSPEDPYEVEIAVPRDTTLLVRVANVAPDAPATAATSYDLRVEVGGFYGASVDVGDIPGIPPGFTVLSGPPSLLGCQGTLDGGSVFDLITADEAADDVRRVSDRAETVGDDVLRQMERMGMDTQALRAQLAAELDAAETELAPKETETARTFNGRSRLEATLVGQNGTGQPCQIVLHATLSGEEGGFQTLTTAHEPDPDDDTPVGIENVTFLAGSLRDALDEPFQVCWMTDEERREAAFGSCPMVCDVGRLSLERAGQNHIQGLFRASVFAIGEDDDPTGDGCGNTQVLPFIFSFNIASGNTGQDAEVARSTSDAMLRLLGATEREIDALREMD